MQESIQPDKREITFPTAHGFHWVHSNFSAIPADKLKLEIGNQTTLLIKSLSAFYGDERI